MKTIVLGGLCGALVACAGSGPAPDLGPVVTSMTPAQGPWGTSVTIDGRNFGPIPEPGNVVAFDAAGAAGFRVDEWHDNEIQGRVAFPATGRIVVQTSHGQAEAGTFATTMTWMPSAALDVSDLAGGLVLSTGDVAGVFRQYEVTSGPTLAVFGGSAKGTYALPDLVDPQATGPLHAQLVEADDHTPEVIATQLDGTVVALSVQGGTLATASTGLTGTVLAAARDATGLYAWIDTGSGLVRARPGTPWTVDRGPISSPLVAVAGAVAADGTLWLAVSEPAPASQAYTSLEVLAPADTQFEAPERVDPTAHDALTDARVILSSDGVHGVVIAEDTAGGHSTTLTPRERSAPGAWDDAPAMPGLVQYTYLGATLAAIVNDASSETTSLVRDVTMPSAAELIPVWPLLSQGVVIDAAGAPHPLIGNGSVSYALTPPP